VGAGLQGAGWLASLLFFQDSRPGPPESNHLVSSPSGCIGSFHICAKVNKTALGCKEGSVDNAV
jgi:hypothetical protein